MKTGHLDPAYFRTKHGIDILREFAPAFTQLEREGWLNVRPDSIDCTPAGLMQIDRHLPAFFDPQYKAARYT